jgi:hypothetical protein
MESIKSIKDNYLSDLGKEESSKLDELTLAILDEVIENIENGQANIEGRKPSTRNEYFMLISLCAEDAKKQLIKIAGKAAIPNGEVQEIQVTFRNMKYEIKVRVDPPTNHA